MIDAFIDTNILLYAASDAPSEAVKAGIARALIENVGSRISVQVLQEFYVNAAGKLAVNIPREKLDQVLRLIREQSVAPITVEVFESAVRLSQISYWDAAIIASAKEMGAQTIYSEVQRI